MRCVVALSNSFIRKNHAASEKHAAGWINLYADRRWRDAQGRALIAILDVHGLAPDVVIAMAALYGLNNVFDRFDKWSFFVSVAHKPFVGWQLLDELAKRRALGRSKKVEMHDIILSMCE